MTTQRSRSHFQVCACTRARACVSGLVERVNACTCPAAVANSNRDLSKKHSVCPTVQHAANADHKPCAGHASARHRQQGDRAIETLSHFAPSIRITSHVLGSSVASCSNFLTYSNLDLAIIATQPCRIAYVSTRAACERGRVGAASNNENAWRLHTCEYQFAFHTSQKSETAFASNTSAQEHVPVTSKCT